MDWSNEEYVRVYTRETGDDLDLSWEALALWRAMLIKFDRSGLIAAKNGWLSVSRMTRIPHDVVERCGPELIRDGRVRQVDGGFFAPNFTEAQTTSKSDKARQRESRDRRRNNAKLQSDNCDANHNSSRAVTGGHAESRASHERSQNVTLASAEPLLTDSGASAGLPGDRPAAPAQQGAFEAFASKVDDSTKGRDRKARLPDDWEPNRSDANREAESAARSRGIDLAFELKRMRDWAKAGSEKKSDWDATWRNWTRSARPVPQAKTQQQSALDTQLERVRRLEEEERRANGGESK